MYRTLHSLLVILFVTSSSFSQSVYKKALQDYRANLLPEKVFLHTDKDVYAAGETIWGAVYLVDGQTHKPSAFSTTIYVELINKDQEVVQSLKVLQVEDSGTLSIKLAPDTNEGEYQLRAYTNYQQNSGLQTLYRKTIAVVNSFEAPSVQTNLMVNLSSEKNIKEQTINLKFFPEGGDCVVGLPCTMAIVAQDKSNNPIVTSGKIFNGQDEFVTLFETNEKGMGRISYTPKSNERYVAKIEDQSHAQSLVKPLEKGFTLNVLQQGDNVNLLINTNLKGGLKNASIVVHHRGLLFIEEKLDLSESKTVIPIKKEDLIAGVYVATLFDEKSNPVSERLFFVAPRAASTEISVKLKEETIGTRQALEVSLSNQEMLMIADDSLLSSTLSLSVVPTYASKQTTKDIRTWMLLNSDLDVPIKDAKDILFSLREGARDYMVDLFLMTRGWRRFVWKEVLADAAKKPKYALEQGINIEGKLLKLGSEDKPQKGKVFLAQMEKKLHEEVMTDTKGNFSFGPYILYDTSTFILQGRYKKGRKRKKAKDITIEDSPLVDITLQDRLLPQLPINPLTVTGSDAISLKKYKDLNQDIINTSDSYDLMTVELDEIGITAQRISEKKLQRQQRTSYYSTPSHRLVLDDDQGTRNASAVIDLFWRLPGVTIDGDNIYVLGGPTSFVASTDPLFLLDGSPVSKDVVLSLPVRDIEFIDVLKGADATIYGLRGGNGVILLYSRLRLDWEVDQVPPPGLKRTEVIGYHLAKEFAIIDAPSTDTNFRPDIRSTLHWNPKISLSNKRTTKESFTTSDTAGEYIIVAQGIRKNGVPLFGSLVFNVEE